MIQQYIISNADELLKALSLTLLTFKFKLADCTQTDTTSKKMPRHLSDFVYCLYFLPRLIICKRQRPKSKPSGETGKFQTLINDELFGIV